MTFPHDQYAADYDEQVEKYDCRIAEVVFGLCYGDIAAGETLLDVGIGTGLSSILFHKAGVRIFGIDGSKEMLSICEGKGIAEALVQQDILTVPWPYEDASFQHVISCGVFHFVGELDPVFEEIRRVQAPGGIFAFTVMKGERVLGETERYEQQSVDGLPVFSHSPGYIQDLLKKYQYEKMKEIVGLVGETRFRVICSRKIR